MNKFLRVLGRRDWLIALVLIAFAVGLRAPFTERAFWNLDEGVTFTLAQQILEGDVLYRDAVDHRGPLVPYLKAAALAVCGDWNFAALHQLLGLGLGLFAFGLYRLGTRLGDARAGLFAAGVFSVLSFVIQGAPEALALHTEWFMEAFSLLGFLVLARRRHQPGAGSGLLAGLCFGLAALNKQPGLLDYGVVVVLTSLLAATATDRRAAWLRFLGASVIGVLLPTVVAFGYFAAHGAAADFRWYAWTYNTTIYVPEVPFLARLQAWTLPLDLMGEHAPVLLLITLGGLVGLLVTAFRRIGAVWRGEAELPVLIWLTLGWGAVGWLSCLLSGRTFAHYALHILPGASLAAGWLLARIGPGTGLRRVAIGACAGAALWHVAVVYRAIDDRPDPAAAPLREFAATYSESQDRWFVWGYYPEVYGWAQRLPASRFSYANFLTGLIPWTNTDPALDTGYAVVPGAWEQLRADLESSPPAVLITSSARYYGKYPLLRQPWFREWVPSRFVNLSTPGLRSTSFQAWVQTTGWMGRFFNEGVDRDPAFRPRVRLQDEDLRHPLIRVEVDAPIGTTEAMLFVGNHLLRAVTLSPVSEVTVGFVVAYSELEALRSDAVSVSLSGPDFSKMSRPLHVARRLDLNPAAFVQQPQMSAGLDLVSATASTGTWTQSQRDGRWGWSSADGGSLDFEVSSAQQRFSFRWESETPPELSATTSPGNEPARFDVKELSPGHWSLIFTEPGARRIHLAAPAAGGPLWIGDLIADAVGPVLYLGRETVRPLRTEIGVGGVPTSEDQDRWFMHAPARAVYALRPGLTGVFMRYGFIEDTWQRPPEHPTTGAEFRLEHHHPHGTIDILFRRYLNPVVHEHDRGEQQVEYPLISRSEGELHFVIDEGDFDERSGDWTYLSNGRLLGPGPDITTPDEQLRLTPRSGTFGDGEIIDTRTPDDGWDAHAPSRLIYDFPSELAAVTVRFAFKEGAWRDRIEPHVTDGIELIVERLRPDGSVEELHRSAWNPATNPSHRGPLAVDVHLPTPNVGDRLVIRTTTGPAGEEEFDWTVWNAFSGHRRESTAPTP